MKTRKISRRSSIEVNLYIFPLYYKRNIKHFFPCRYTVISTLVEIGKTCGRLVSTQFLVFPIPCTRVDITAYQHEKCLYFLNVKRRVNVNKVIEIKMRANDNITIVYLQSEKILLILLLYLQSLCLHII